MSERSFFTLKRLKRYIRNTTGQSRLNGLTLMNIDGDDQKTKEQVINDFYKC